MWGLLEVRPRLGLWAGRQCDGSGELGRSPSAPFLPWPPTSLQSLWRCCDGVCLHGRAVDEEFNHVVEVSNARGFTAAEVQAVVGPALGPEGAILDVQWHNDTTILVVCNNGGSGFCVGRAVGAQD